MRPKGAGAATSMRAAQAGLTSAMLKETIGLWNGVNPENPFDPNSGWLRLMIVMLERYRRESVAIAETSYNEVRREVTGNLVPFKLPSIELVPNLKMMASLMATGPGRMRQLLKQGYAPAQAHRDALPLLSGVAVKQTLDAGREAVLDGIGEDDEAEGYARVARPKACAWCRMLAGRGAVYSKETATKVTGRRGSQKVGEEFHDFCKCFAVPVFRHDQGLPDANKQHAKDWANSTEGLSGKAAIAAFRAYTGAN